METLILVSEPKAAKKLKNRELSNSAIVSLNDATSGALASEGIIFSTLNDYLTEKDSKNIIDSSIRWLREWSNRSGIKSITYRNISVWWFFDFWLYYSFFKWDMVKSMIWYIDSIDIVIRKTNPKKVFVIGNRTVAEIARIIFPEAKSLVYNDRQIMHAYVVDLGVRAKHVLRRLASRIVYHGHKEEKKDILFATYTSWFRPCLREDGKTGKEDAILGYVVRKAMKKYNVLVADIDFTKTLGIDLMMQKKESEENIPFEHYSNIRIGMFAGSRARDIRKQWKELDDERFAGSCVYRGFNIYNILKPWLDFVFRRRAGLMISYIETALNMLDRTDPRLVFVVDETAIFGRSVTAAAKIKGIPVVAVQHGYITNDSFEYRHIKGDIADDLNAEKPYCPIAEKTAVYGTFTKDILTMPGNYPKHSIEVTGQPRYDCFASKMTFNREKVFNEFGLDRKKKLILWTTQDVPGQDAVVFNAVKNIKNAQLLVKLHPRELAGTEPYYDKAKEIGIEIIAVREANTFELINACDVMITMHSTTGLEAIMMNKPIVVLNISGKPDMVPYVQEGAALGVYKPDQLEGALRDALFDKKAIAKLLKNNQAYSFRHSYKMDGKATERVMKAAESLMKKRK